MPNPRTPYEAVLHAGRDLPRLDQALHAELLGATLLGTVYAVAAGDRMAAVRTFVGSFLSATARRRTVEAAAIRNVLAALVPDAPGAPAVKPGPQPPRWLGQLGRVRLTGAFRYGDVYGDQTSYLATFAYDDPETGGPEHAVVVLVDHNIGIVKDLFVTAPAEPIVASIRRLCDDDELAWFAEADPAALRGEVDRHLRITDQLGELPSAESLVTDRVVAGSRLAVLPGLTPDHPIRPAVDAAAFTRDFLASPEAAALSTVDAETAAFGVSLLLQYADSFTDPDPLRWSPATVDMFLLDWVHRRAVLDELDAAALPAVLRAWVAYAARVRGLPQPASEATAAAVDSLAGEFARLHATGERRSPAAEAAAALLDEGVDPRDADAVEAWLRDTTPHGET